MKLFTLFLLIPYVQAIIKGTSIYGCETDNRNFVCSWVHPVEYYTEQLKKMGFNLLRFPFSYQYVVENNWQSLDHGMEIAFQQNFSVVLDFHRTWNDRQQYSPTSDGVSLDQFISAWLTILNRYQHYPNLIGGNSWNEFQGSNHQDILVYTLPLFDRIEQQFPNRFQYYVTGSNWGGNISSLNEHFRHLPYYNRIYYSVHKYSWSGTADEADWEYSFGNVGVPPDKIVVGEFGWMENKPEQVEWAKRFIAYLKRKNIRNTIYWTIAHSVDTGNLYQDDCQIIKWDNYLLLRTLWEDRRYLRKG